MDQYYKNEIRDNSPCCHVLSKCRPALPRAHTAAASGASDVAKELGQHGQQRDDEDDVQEVVAAHGLQNGEGLRADNRGVGVGVGRRGDGAGPRAAPHRGGEARPAQNDAALLPRPSPE